MPRHLLIPVFFSLAALITFTGCFGIGDGTTVETAPRYGRADRMQYDTVHMQVEFSRQLHTIVIDLNPSAAPQTVENFKNNIGSGYYRGLKFHRVIDDYIVQTGDPLTRKMARRGDWGTGTDYTVPAEIGLKHTRGAVAMARLPGDENPSKASSGSQFYICLKDLPHLDRGYTVFGYVREDGPGLKILDEMSRAPADADDIPLKPITLRAIGLTRPDAPVGKSRPTDTPKPKPMPKEGDPEESKSSRFIKRFW